jgi:SNF2 family DNA or RNA helicase
MTPFLPPQWKQYTTTSGKKYYFNVVTQETTWEFPFIEVANQFEKELPEVSSCLRGGILADEMGLGKTIEILSLILTNPFNAANNYNQRPQSDPVPVKTTLIVCPLTVLNHWVDEIHKNTKPGIAVVVLSLSDSRYEPCLFCFI